MAFEIFLKCLRIGFDGEVGEFDVMGSRMSAQPWGARVSKSITAPQPGSYFLI
jgi:hypothetical protein